MFGWTSKEVLGANVKDLRLRSSRFDEAFEAVLEAGEWSGEVERTRKDGSSLVVDSRWTLVRDSSGRPASVLVFDVDITESKQLQSQFLRAQRMESIGTLAGGIAHDLNNVLSPILMWLEVLREKLPDQKSQRMLELLESSIMRGSGMVRQLLSFSKGVSGARVEVQPKHILRELDRIMRDTFPKSIEIIQEVPNELWTIIGDATQVHQILLNLGVNARDAMPQGGVLTVTCENRMIDENYARMHIDAKPGPYVEISVSDTGTGMRPDVLERIFEPFFTTKEIGKGTGLGLSTSLAIVKGHEGFINVYSEPGKGTTFKVYLPATSRSSSTGTGEQHETLIHGRGELILVVDDEAIIRDTLEATMERYGYKALTAEDGAQAVALYSKYQDKISVVLTDMMMPFMDGPATIRALQRIDPDVKIIGASGLSENEKLIETRNLKIHGFLHKPFTTRDLLKLLAAALGRNGSNQHSYEQKGDL